jgi:RNA polymerase sigma-70 factor, ECF subfamily
LSSSSPGRALAFPLLSKDSARCDTLKYPKPGDDVSDEALIVRLERGDHGALETLFNRYSRLVFGIGFNVLRDQGEAEELIQEVFLRIFEKPQDFDEKRGRVQPWIAQMAYYRALDRRSYLGRRRFYSGTNLNAAEDILESEVRLEEEVSFRLSGQQMRTAFEELSEKQKLTLEMFFFEGHSLREISKCLNEPVERIRHYYYRGLDRLRKTALAAALGEGASH